MEQHHPARKAAVALLMGLALWSTAALAAPGDPLGPPLAVNTYQAGAERITALAASQADFRVFWVSSTASSVHSFQTRYDSVGNPLTGDVAVPGYSGVGDAASAPDGRHVIISYGYDGNRARLVGRRYASDGSMVGSDFEITDPLDTVGVLTTGFPRVAMNAAGDFVVVWGQGKPSANSGPTCNGGFGAPRTCLGSYQTKILARRYTDGGMSAQPIVTVDSASFTTALVYGLGAEALGPEISYPSVALANNGSYAVSWTSNSEISPLVRQRQVKLRHYPASGAVPLARTVEDATTLAGSQVVFDGMGNSVVVFRKHAFGNQSAASLWLRRYSTSSHNALGPALRVDTGLQMQQEDQLAAASDGNGSVVVAWTDPAGVYFQRYAAGGAAAGGNVKVSVGGVTHRSAKIAWGSGRFMIGWTQSLDPYSQSDVKARLYEGP
ncbi:hypothetical protein [Solimonas sp. SE-A11]|uniref:hypothetical protein n=1 Tax=Solimonas sp. SE-A11 TaxID=3054954 RepID=UPI00259CF109|nr:hypothetical protein [Solimonas sp. SE-A11]MDM4769522.1 hypothetical protein [Solimonas sp. SE-A11]